MKLTVVRALVAFALLLTSPVLLLAGHRSAAGTSRHVHRDGVPQTLDKERGLVGVHYFVITSRLLAWCCRPTEALEGFRARRGGTPAL